MRYPTLKDACDLANLAVTHSVEVYAARVASLKDLLTGEDDPVKIRQLQLILRLADAQRDLQGGFQVEFLPMELYNVLGEMQRMVRAAMEFDELHSQE